MSDKRVCPQCGGVDNSDFCQACEDAGRPQPTHFEAVNPSMPCLAWADGMHCYSEDEDRPYLGKQCACGKTVERTRP